MTRNIGGLDQGTRIAIGVLIVVLGYVGPFGWWGLAGLFPLGTGVVGNCPLYRALGVNTCPTRPGA